MRITSGQYRGKTLKTPKGRDTRPTSDRVRESLFNILNHAKWSHALEDSTVLDLFCGTGALGLEALSHGASFCSFVDKSDACARLNVAELQVTEQTHILKTDALKLPERPSLIKPANFVFVDPPYDKDLGGKALNRALEKNCIAPQSICIIESSKKHPENISDNFELLDERTYASTMIRCYRAE